MSRSTEIEMKPGKNVHPVEAVVSSLAGEILRKGLEKKELEIKSLTDVQLLEKANKAGVTLSEEVRQKIINGIMINETIPSFRMLIQI